MFVVNWCLILANVAILPYFLFLLVIAVSAILSRRRIQLLGDEALRRVS